MLKSGNCQEHEKSEEPRAGTEKAKRCECSGQSECDRQPNTHTHTHFGDESRKVYFKQRLAKQRFPWKYAQEEREDVMNAFQDFELGAKLYLQCLCNAKRSKERGLFKVPLDYNHIITI